MENKYVLVFDEVMLKQLKQAGTDGTVRIFLSKMLNKLEEMGPLAGKLLDSQLSIYEVKMKRPPIRLYYKYNKATNELYVFEYEMKTSPTKQNQTIQRIRKKASES
jgi:mRNA-degrading endonuclease RelE of RelBE toxin-antitoxin system